MSEQPPQTIVAELCFDLPPRLDAQRILHGIRRHRPDATLVEGDRHGALLVRYQQLADLFPNARSAPLLNAVTTAVEDHNGRDLSHTCWAAAGEALRDCRYSVLVTEFLGREVPAADRLAAYRAVLAAVIESTAPLAVWWPGSQQAMDPHRAAEDPLRGVFNVRTFPDPDDRDVALMDTIGLSQLGLPDLQCHFRYLSQELMADLLRNAASFLAGGGRFDGAMRGLTVHQQWPVRRARALAAPIRPVLSIDPGDPFTVRPAG